MNKQILLIDDSQQIHPLVKAILGQESVEVFSATEAKYGLTLAASIQPDLILLDIDMPGMDGFSLCKILKSKPETAGCPIIFLTAHALAQEKVHGFALGAVDYVTKPFNPAELVARVRSSLNTRAVIRSLEEHSLTDPLSGLGNRAMFERRLEAEIATRIRFHDPLSILVMEVDHFQTLNSTGGPHAGEKLLGQTGKLIAEACRVEDVACRMNGGEFAIIATHTAAPDAIKLAERIRAKLATLRLEKTAAPANPLVSNETHITASIGVADANDPYDRSMLQRAELALADAKKTGNAIKTSAAAAEQSARMSA